MVTSGQRTTQEATRVAIAGVACSRDLVSFLRALAPAALLAVSPAVAQDAAESEPVRIADQADGTIEDEGVTDESAETATAADLGFDQTVAAPRLALLREGSMVVRSMGVVERDARRGWWEFLPGPAAPGEPQRRMVLLPSGRLEDIERIVEVTGPETRFEITGEVLVHKGENYLLPTLAVPLKNTAPAEAPDAPAEADEPIDQRDDASRIEERLRAQVGPVARSADTGAIGGGEGGSLLPDESRLRLRRGVLMRNNDTGGWRVVLDADASGRADPPLDLLPCQLLHSLERYARTSDGPAPLLISGRVLSYRGRNFLLPTSYQTPRTGQTLAPGRTDRLP